MSTVIKAGEAGRILRRLSTVCLADHLAEARAVLDEARRRAAQLAARAQEEAQAALAEARAAGREAGHREGYEAGVAAGRQAAHDEAIVEFRREHGRLVADLERAIGEVDALKEDLRVAAQRDLLDFAVLIAGKLTFGIGRLDREAARENFSRALAVVGSKTDLTVRVHPDDVESLRTFAESALKRLESSAVVRLTPDESVAPGGCTVRNEKIEVDATLQTQVDELVALLLGGATSDG